MNDTLSGYVVVVIVLLLFVFFLVACWLADYYEERNQK